MITRADAIAFAKQSLKLSGSHSGIRAIDAFSLFNNPAPRNHAQWGRMKLVRIEPMKRPIVRIAAAYFAGITSQQHHAPHTGGGHMVEPVSGLEGSQPKVLTAMNGVQTADADRTVRSNHKHSRRKPCHSSISSP